MNFRIREIFSFALLALAASGCRSTTRLALGIPTLAPLLGHAELANIPTAERNTLLWGIKTDISNGKYPLAWIFFQDPTPDKDQNPVLLMTTALQDGIYFRLQLDALPGRIQSPDVIKTSIPLPIQDGLAHARITDLPRGLYVARIIPTASVPFLRIPPDRDLPPFFLETVIQYVRVGTALTPQEQTAATEVVRKRVQASCAEIRSLLQIAPGGRDPLATFVYTPDFERHPLSVVYEKLREAKGLPMKSRDSILAVVATQLNRACPSGDEKAWSLGAWQPLSHQRENSKPVTPIHLGQ